MFNPDDTNKSSNVNKLDSFRKSYAEGIPLSAR